MTANKLIMKWACILSFFLLAACTPIHKEVSAKRAYQECSEIDDCVAAIRTAIEQNWIRPQSARNGMKVKLYVVMEPDGSVTNIEITSSSGNKAFDAHAIKAVQTASPFSEISGMSQEIYDNYFSRFILIFNPMDLSK